MYIIIVNAGNVFLVHAMKADAGAEVELRSFLTSPLGGGEWPTSRSSCFTFKKGPLY